MKKILLSLLIIGIIGIGVVKLSLAYFSDTETSTGNNFTAGKVDLKIDNTSYLNGILNPETTWLATDLEGKFFFNFTDLKPNDLGEDTISLHVEDNNSWACMQANITQNDDNTCTEPELIDDPTCTPPGANQGELAQNVNFVFWVDDGDNVLEDNEVVFREGSALSLFDNTVWTLADSLTNLFESTGPLLGAKTYFIGKAWCFGTLTKTPVPEGEGIDPTVNGGVTCDGSNLDNATQTDIVKGDVTFNVVQSRNNPSFVCNPQTPTPSPSPSPPPLISCEENAVIYATSFSDNDQGLRKDSTAVLANRSIPGAAFGAPQTTGADSDVGTPIGSFFSLGFPLGGNSASIVFGFSEPFYPNPSGPDLQIFEVTGGVYPDEKVKVEASSTAIGPWTVLATSVARDEDIELGILPSAQFIRLTEVSDINLFSGTGDATPDGYDLDALKAFCTQVD